MAAMKVTSVAGSTGPLVSINFVELVVKMRNAQSGYFNNRSHDRLRTSKHFEQAVDKAVQEIEAQLNIKGASINRLDKEPEKINLFSKL